jgi:hypothetical protein
MLAQARTEIAKLADTTKEPLAIRKLHELEETMALVSGLSLEAQSNANVIPGGNLRVGITAILRSPAQVTLTGVKLAGIDGAPALNVAPTVLPDNQPSQYTLNARIPDDQPYSQPYWLVRPKSGNMYSVPDAREIGLAENPPALEAHFNVKIAGQDIEFARPVQNRYTDQVYGDLMRPLAIVPPVAVDFTEHSLIFPDTRMRQIQVTVRSNGGKSAGEARLDLPSTWKVEPASRHFELAGTGEQATLDFDLTPPAEASQARVRAVAQTGGKSVTQGTEVLLYSHFPAQTLFPVAESSLVRADILTLSKNIGYVTGAGDDVPAALRQMGCEVTLLSPSDLASGNLSRFDAIVTGVRAFNTRPDLRANYQRLFDYAYNGGTVIVQYNRAQAGAGPAGGRGGQGKQAAGGKQEAPAQPQPQQQTPPPGADETGFLDHVGPYSIHVSNERVTDEDAAVTFPNPQVPLLHRPNEITEADFRGWVQERGLNFADKWDDKYLSVLSSHDPDEDPLPGGMLYLKFGKGAYMYSAYDWFRELPAGVPGAYRMFANMLSAAKAQ